ncbi:MAG: large subunit ribosomal protein L9 [Planctomycetota bacterium]|jgi:large subunit ribosomal protein L9
MANVIILLRENVKDLGLIGDVVEVAPGYARNYLLPRKLAVSASKENIRYMERRRARWDADEATRVSDLEKQIEALGKVKVSTAEKADESGSLYGSVGNATIARLLTEAGFATEEKAVRLPEPIKSVGAHEVSVHVHGEHFATIQLEVTAAP